jgi:hypothetical protein
VGSESIARPRDTATRAPRYPAVYPFRTPEERRSGQRGRRKPSPCGNAMTRTSDATRVRLLFATPPIAPRLIRRPTLLHFTRSPRTRTSPAPPAALQSLSPTVALCPFPPLLSPALALCPAFLPALRAVAARAPSLPPHASSLRARPLVLPSSLRLSASTTSMHPTGDEDEDGGSDKVGHGGIWI